MLIKASIWLAGQFHSFFFFEKKKNFSILSADPVILKAESVPYALSLLCNLNNTSAILRPIEKQSLETYKSERN